MIIATGFWGSSGGLALATAIGAGVGALIGGLVGVFGTLAATNKSIASARQTQNETLAATERMQEESLQHQIDLERERRQQERRATTYVSAIRFAEETWALTSRWFLALGMGDTAQVERLTQSDFNSERALASSDAEGQLSAEIQVFASEEARIAFNAYTETRTGFQLEMLAAVTALRQQDHSELAQRLSTIEDHMGTLNQARDAMAATMRRELAPGARPAQSPK